MFSRDFRAAMADVPGLERGVDRLVKRAEAALDRAAEAVERGVGRVERAFDDLGAASTGPRPGPRPDPAPEDAGSRPSPDSDHSARSAEAAPDHGEPAGAGDRKGGGAAGAYGAFVERTRGGVARGVGRGLHALDAKAGDRPWRLAGLDERGTRIAREVMREVVPEVAGERAASVVDGAALKSGVAGAGLLLRIPLKGFAAPFLLGITAVETVRAVRDVRARVNDVAARVDNEAASRAAYEAGTPA